MSGLLMAGAVLCGSCGSAVPASLRRCTTCGSAFVGAAPDAPTGVFVPPAELADAAPGAAVRAGTGAALVVLRGGSVGDVVELSGATTTAGRAAEVDLLLADISVSRRHARFTGDGSDGPVVLTDLGSLNGTYVNGARIDAITLADGDVIRIGRFQLRFRAPGGA